MAEYIFNWSNSLSLECGTELPADQLNRASYALFLTNYLVATAAHGYVLNLNSGWGTGKTYFLKRWEESIKKHHPTVYIDAWKQDFSDDPLLTVVSSIICQLKAQADKYADPFVIEKADKAVRLFKSVAPALTKGIVKKLTGVKIDEIAESYNCDNETPNKVGDLGLGEAAGKVVQSLLDDHHSKIAGAEAFKDAMESWIKSVTNKEGINSPTFIFIDELDRCRPSYAIEMLEVIKHIFDIPLVIFVVATDTEQLQHAVKAIYGNNFDASMYLSRFFKRRCTLKEQSRYEFIKNHFEHLSSLSLDRFNTTVWPELVGNSEQCIEDLSRYISAIADVYQLPLRETEQLVDKLTAVIMNCKLPKIDILFLTSLMILHDREYEYYTAIINETRPKEVRDKFYEPAALHHYLERYDYSTEISVNIQPSKVFHNGTVSRGNVGYKVNIEDGYHKISYLGLLSIQLINSTSNRASIENHYQKVLTCVSRDSSKSPPIRNIVGQEQLGLQVPKETYRQLVEHAATFDD
ncbi:KAP family P-loop NTPase fold protein [Thaumasiovibrio subtropicus]|uniref:KAP family P-loop NTPase fold protein n=1 Tax=Thaumasiovibrio subtropicus TaxID=1891207 RepID=UPI00131E566C|nr:P-loop NTPase fold protein [Thaumasiovibrio subtropicus]